MLAEKLKAFLGCERMTFFLQDAEGNLDSIYADGLSEPIHLEAGKGLAGLGSRIKKTVYSNDPYGHPDFHDTVDAGSGFKTSSLMATPLLRDKKVTGVAEFLNKTGGFSDEDARSLTRLGPEIQIIYDKLKGDIDRTWMQASLMRAEKLAALGRLVAGLAHEIRNPLTGILANAQLLKRTLSADEEKREVVADIETAVRHCNELMRSLLVFSRKEPQKRAINSLNEIAEASLKLFGKRFELSNIDIVRSYGDGLPPASCSKSAVQQVVVNLLANARQAMPKGGILSISTRTGAKDEFERERTEVSAPSLGLDLSVRSRSRSVHTGSAFWLVLEVADTGPGIHEDDMARLFDAFYSTKPPGEGVGLGLSVSREIIDQHGGLLLARNLSAGRGAIFTVALPINTGCGVSGG